jgi:diadenylate cyclase
MNLLDSLRTLRPDLRDLLEIAIVSFAIYRLILIFQRRRAMQILASVAVLIGVFAVARLFDLTLITYLLSIVFSYGAFALLIVFAPELRTTLAQFGRTPMSRLFRLMGKTEVASEVAEATGRLSASGHGAIIVLERERSLEEYIEHGSPIQARVSADLIVTIFTPFSPLHDGAMIVRGDTIVAAGCILPLSQTAILDRSLGTRHRAALGLSEETDATVIVVSEETRSVSVATAGRLWRDITLSQLGDLLSGRTPQAMVLDPDAARSTA